MSAIGGEYASIEINKQIKSQNFKIPKVAQLEYLKQSLHGLVVRLHQHNRVMCPETGAFHCAMVAASRTASSDTLLPYSSKIGSAHRELGNC